jgi:hypothetical protein
LLPSAFGGASCTDLVANTSVTDPTACSLGVSAAGVTLTGFPTATAQVSGPGSGLAQLTYSFEVVGGTAGTQVPLIITANLETSASGGAASQAIINVFAASTVSQEACSNLTCAGTSFSGNLAALATVGQVNSISLSAGTSIGTEGSHSGFASADPLIVVDPTFANASQYSVILSPGVANGVPEPEYSWLLGCSLTSLAVLRKTMDVSPGLRRQPLHTRTSGLLTAACLHDRGKVTGDPLQLSL